MSVWDTSTTLEYWDERHRTAGSWQAGGHASFGSAANALLYTVRLVRLAEVLGQSTSEVAPLRVLDAGCGQGFFSRGMSSFGHQVDGIDASPSAIGICREQQVDDETYAVSTLSQWRPGYLYDAVFSIDVLFHIMDDDEWEASVTNLASLVRLGGLLMLADHAADRDKVWSSYQKSRARSRYVSTVTALGFQERGFHANGGPGDPVGLHVFGRVA